MTPTEMLEVLGRIKSSLSSIEFIPVLTHFCFDAGKERVLAFNDITAVSTPMDFPFTGALRGDLVLSALGTFPPNKPVEVNDEREGEVMLKCGRSRLTLKSLPESAFIFKEPKGDVLAEFTVTKELTEGLARALMTVGEDAMQKALTGVLVKLNKKAGAIEFLSSNAVCITRSVVKKQKVSGDATLLVPKGFCEQLISLRGSLGDGKAEVLKDWVRVVFGKATLYSRLMLDAPMPIEKILREKMPEKGWIKKPAGMQGSFARAVLVMRDEPIKKVTATLDPDNGLALTAIGSLGEVKDRHPTKEEGVKAQAVVEGQRLLPLLEYADSIAFNTAVFALRGQDGFEALVSNIGS
jgi:hypothetical protein